MFLRYQMVHQQVDLVRNRFPNLFNENNKGPSLFCVGSSKLIHSWDSQIKVTGSVIGGGSEVDEVSKPARHSFG